MTPVQIDFLVKCGAYVCAGWIVFITLCISALVWGYIESRRKEDK
jgi:hypothetical protein